MKLVCDSFTGEPLTYEGGTQLKMVSGKQFTMIDMNHYTLTLKHDHGSVKVSTWAATLKQAVKTILQAECAPESAIRGLRIKTRKTK